MTNPLIPDPAAGDAAPVMFFNGTIHSTQEPYAEAMLIEAGRVVWLGTDETAERLTDDRTLTKDLDRALVTPAFVGAITVSVEEASTGTLAEMLDVAAREFGYAALRVELSVSAEELATTAGRSELIASLRQSLRTAEGHPVDTFPVLRLTGVDADGGAPSITPVNTALDVAEELDSEADHPLALQLIFSQVSPNLLGVRSWCAEAGRQLVLDCTGSAPLPVVEAITNSQVHLRELMQTPSAATPTVVLGFDSEHPEHWQALLDAGVHVVLNEPGHLGTALRVGVPTAAAPGQGQNPWQLVSSHAHHAVDPVSVRAGFNAQTRGSYRSLVGAEPGAGQLNPGSTATFTIWQADQLTIQSPNTTAAAWSTDTRARTPLLPYLDGANVPRLISTVIEGQGL